MKFLILSLCILNFTLSSPAFADDDIPEAYEVEDGLTGGAADDTVLGEAPAAAPAAEVTKDESGQVVYNAVSRKPPCGTTTCITPQSIENARHAYVQKSAVKTYLKLFELPEAEENETGGEDEEAACKAPIKTGMTIFRQTLPEDDNGGPGILKNHNDGFCVNQGCVYFGIDGNERCEFVGS